MALLGTLGLGAVVTMKDRASRQMDRLNQSFVRLHKQADRSLKGVEEQMEKLDKRMDRSRAGLGKSLKVMGAGMVMAVPLALAGKAAATFQDSMNDVLSIVMATGLGEDEARAKVKELGDEILAFAGKTRVPLNELAASAYELTSALGIETAKGAFQSAANQAVAGKGTIVDSTKVMTSVLANFGLDWDATMTKVEQSKKVFNVISGTIAAFNTDLTRLSAGLTYATPSANLLGMEFSEMTATLGMLQTKGLEASMSGTAFAAGLRGIIKTTSTFTDEAEKAKVAAMDMGEYLAHFEGQQLGGKLKKGAKGSGALANLNLTDKSGKMIPLWNILQQIEKAFGITSETAEETAAKMEAVRAGTMTAEEAFKVEALSMEHANAMQSTFTDEGSRMFSLLLGQSEALKAYAQGIDESTMGVTMLNVRQSGAIAKWEMMKNALKSTAIMFGKELLPAIDSVIIGLGTLVERVQSFMKAHPTATKWIAWGGGVFSILMIVGGAIGSVVFAMRMWRAQTAMMQLAGMKTGGLFKTLGNNAIVLRARLIALATAEKVLAGAKIFLATVTKILSAVMGFFNMVLMATPIGWLVLGITAVIAIIYALIFHFDWVKEVASATWEGIKWGLGKLWGYLKDFGRFFEELWDKFGWLITTSPPFLLIKGMIDSVKWLLEALGLIGGPELTVKPGTLDPRLLTPEKLAKTGAPSGGDEVRSVATGKAAPALPETGGLSNQIITTNHFHIQGKEKTAKELAREMTKHQLNAQMRTVQGVN